MARTTKIKTQAATAPVPQNRDDAVAAIARIGHHQRERERLKGEMDEQITALREQYDKQMGPHVDDIKSLTAGIHTWAEANRDDLTQCGKVKTANLMTGELRWRTTPPSCKLVRIKEALEELKKKKLTRFIRTKEEVNKEAILADQAAIDGCEWIKIEQSEDFVIVPFETELEEVA
jgi:phage host-nuclease inhibitor protein Gam